MVSPSSPSLLLALMGDDPSRSLARLVGLAWVAEEERRKTRAPTSLLSFALFSFFAYATFPNGKRYSGLWWWWYFLRLLSFLCPHTPMLARSAPLSSPF